MLNVEVHWHRDLENRDNEGPAFRYSTMNGEHLAEYKFSMYDSIDVRHCRQLGCNAQCDAGKIPEAAQPARVPEIIFKGITTRVPEETIIWSPELGVYPMNKRRMGFKASHNEHLFWWNFEDIRRERQVLD